MSEQLAVIGQNQSLTLPAAFDHIQRVAKCWSESALIPAVFQKSIPNTVIALDIAQRMGANPLAVMQNLYIVHGKPGWSATFLIATVNTCGRFSPLRFDLKNLGSKTTKGVTYNDSSCVAWTTEKGVELPKGIATLDQARAAGIPVLESPVVSIEMAILEEWFQKNGSKWKTMPELMLRYRAATFFTRLYAPEFTMGMRTSDEILDSGNVVDVGGEGEPMVSFNKEIKVRRVQGEVVVDPPQTVDVSAPPTTGPIPETTTAAPSPAEEEKPQDVPTSAAVEAKWSTVANQFNAAGATFDDVMTVLKQMRCTWATNTTAKDWPDLNDENIGYIVKSMRGVIAEVKRHVAVKKSTTAAQ